MKITKIFVNKKRITKKDIQKIFYAFDVMPDYGSIRIPYHKYEDIVRAVKNKHNLPFSYMNITKNPNSYDLELEFSATSVTFTSKIKLLNCIWDYLLNEYKKYKGEII